jgi:hypothetical protein
MKSDISAYRNNQRAYEDVIAGKDSANRVLKLTTGDLRRSNDKYVQELEKTRKSLKRALNKPGDVSVGIGTEIHSTDTTYINNPCNFKLDTVVIHNELTRDSIKIENNKLISTISINNIQSLYVYSTREYVNEYDGWFKGGLNRLIRLDWRKETIDRYDIVNTNDLIKVNNVRVIKVR